MLLHGLIVQDLKITDNFKSIEEFYMRSPCVRKRRQNNIVRILQFQPSDVRGSPLPLPQLAPRAYEC
jgi:hypothetical protein